MPDENAAPEPVPRLADILWPDGEAEWELRARIAGVTGTSPERVAWELFALRDHALDVMYSLMYEGRNVPREMTAAILTLMEPKAGLVPAPPNVEEWRASRDALYTGVMPGGPEDRPFAEIWGEWTLRVGGCFAAAFDSQDGGVAHVGVLEYDKAAKQFFPLCKQLPDQWR